MVVILMSSNTTHSKAQLKIGTKREESRPVEAFKKTKRQMFVQKPRKQKKSIHFCDEERSRLTLVFEDADCFSIKRN